MTICSEVINVRVEALKLEGKEVGVCVDLQVRRSRKAEVRWSAVEVDGYGLVEAARSRGEWRVGVDVEAGHPRNNESEDEADPGGVYMVLSA